MKHIQILIIGDVITLTLITLVGFATHGETSLSLLPRMMTTFIPLFLGWFLLAPWLKLFDRKITSSPRQLWRPIYAVALAIPLTGLLRAAMLNSVVLPIFVLILGASTALGMFIWRAIFLFIQRRLPLVQ